jgi:hypothetical protein
MQLVPLRHGAVLPPALTRAWLAHLAPALSSLFAAGAAADRGVTARLAWVMRCLQELCAVEGSRLAAGAGAAATGAAGGTPSSESGDEMVDSEAGAEGAGGVGGGAGGGAGESQGGGEGAGPGGADESSWWVGVRQCLVQWLPTYASNHTLSSEALLLVAGIASSRLAPPAPLPGRFWKHKALSTSAADDNGVKAPPSTAALEATAALAAADGATRRKQGWHAARAAWTLLRLQPPPAGRFALTPGRQLGDVDRTGCHQLNACFDAQ